MTLNRVEDLVREEDLCTGCGHPRAVHHEPPIESRWQCTGVAHAFQGTGVIVCTCDGFRESAELMPTLYSEALRATNGDAARAARLLKQWANDDPKVKATIRQHMASTSWPEITRALVAEGLEPEETVS